MSESLTNKVLELVSNLVVHSSIKNLYSCLHLTNILLGPMFLPKSAAINHVDNIKIKHNYYYVCVHLVFSTNC